MRKMPRPFELDPAELQQRLDEMVEATFGDLQSEFWVMPKGNGFIEYLDFQAAYEVLKRTTAAFTKLDEGSVWDALEEDALTLVVLRTILGVSPPEWASLAKAEYGVEVPQGAARGLDTRVRQQRDCLARVRRKPESTTHKRVAALVSIAIEHITRGAPAGAEDTVHRLAKVDTSDGLASLRHVAASHVPYAVLLYERYLGSPFISHRNSVSTLVGDVMESAIEERLSHVKVTFRKTKRAERVRGFDQAPDFFVPTEMAPTVLIEAKITSDDGTARDKVARILRLAEMRDRRLRDGQPSFELVACIDGRGFGVRRQDMRDMLTATKGKVFTLTTLDRLIEHTRIKEFLPRGSGPRS
jgi:hypothetical protein